MYSSLFTCFRLVASVIFKLLGTKFVMINLSTYGKESPFGLFWTYACSRFPLISCLSRPWHNNGDDDSYGADQNYPTDKEDSWRSGSQPRLVAQPHWGLSGKWVTPSEPQFLHSEDKEVGWPPELTIRSVRLENDTMYSASVLSRVQLFVTPWTVVRRAPWSMGSPRQEYCSGLPFPLSGDLPNSGIKPVSLAFPVLAGRFLTTEPHLGSPKIKGICYYFKRRKTGISLVV